jgi:CRISPR-associated protein Csx10
MIALKVAITLCEPVLVTAPGGDPNSNISLPYIPGSVIRGAVIHRGLDSGVSEKLIKACLASEIRFLNGYPLTNDFEEGRHRALPFPEALVEDKSRIEESRASNRFATNVLAPKSLKDTFGWTQDGALYTYPKEDEIVVHNTRDREMGKAGSREDGQEGAVFQYQALARDTMFEAVILSPEAFAQEIETLLNGYLWFGGAASAGYGKVRCQTSRAGNWRETPGQLPNGIRAGAQFTMVLLSHALTRDQTTGQTGDFVLQALNRQAQTPFATLERAYTRLEWVGGFNRTWGLPLSQEWVVRAGGSYLLKAQRDVSRAELENLEQEGIGERRAEGFGRIVFNWGWPDTISYTKGKQRIEVQLEDGGLSDGERKLAKEMARRVLQRQLDRAVTAAIVRTPIRRNGVRNSQIARLRLQCREAFNRGSAQFITGYLKDVRERSVARDQLQKVKIDRQSALQWIETVIEQKGDKFWEQLKVGKVAEFSPANVIRPEGWKEEAELQHRYKVRLIDGVLARLAKQSEAMEDGNE